MPRDHPARAIWDLTGELDLSAFAAEVRAVEGHAGQSAIHPRLLVSLWLLAYSEGVGSAREISRRTTYQPAYQWLTGFDEINYHTLADFRVKHKAGLDQLFAQLLGILTKEGLVTLERVMHDGTKIRAVASRGSFHREKTLEDYVRRAEQHVKDMGDPLQEVQQSKRQKKAQERAARENSERLAVARAELQKILKTKKKAEDKEEARVSVTEPEARVMRQALNAGFAPAYNVQISTDAAAGIIIAVEPTQNSDDHPQLVPAIERIETTIGSVPKQMVVDGGYISREQVIEAEAKTEIIGPVDPEKAKQEQERRRVNADYAISQLSYDAESNTCRCPMGQALVHLQRRDRKGRVEHVYVAAKSACKSCAARPQCCPNASDGRRRITRIEERPSWAAFVARMKTEAAQQAYKQRSQVAEFPNLWIKSKIQLRRFHVAGLRKVRMETIWAALTHNVQQWIRLCWRKRLATIV